MKLRTMFVSAVLLLASGLAAQQTATVAGTGGGGFGDTGLPATTTVDFAVSGLTGTTNVSNVEVTISIHHTWLGDVNLTLTDPQSNVHSLFDGIGTGTFGDSTNFGDPVTPVHAPYTFNDTATGDIFAVAAALGTAVPLTSPGPYRTVDTNGAPTVMTATFSGITAAQANGTWTLTFTDTFTTGDPGDVLGTSCSLTVEAPSAGGDPEINLQETSGTPVDHLSGTTQNLGDLTTGVQSTGNFTIQNLGATNPLTITSINAVATGVMNCTVSASALTGGSPIAAASSDTFTGMVTPTTDGPFEFTLTILNDDVDESTYVVIYQGNGVSPEIDVQRPSGSANSIADGGNDTEAGTVSLVTTTLTYTIENTGTGDLTLPAVSVATSGTSNCTATVMSQPGTTIAASGGTAAFTIDVQPAGAGAWSFDIDITSDDSDEANYDINVSGTASATPTPQLEVSRSSVIASGGTDNAFGSVDQILATYTYTATNSGSADLTFNATAVAVTTGTGAPTVAVNAQATGTITPTNSTTFAIDVTPQVAGAWTATVTVASDDPNSPYSFTISGTAQAVAGPEIAVDGPGSTAIANNGSFSESATGTVNFSRSFVVRNEGANLLTLTPTGAPVVIGLTPTNCSVTVTTQPSDTIASGGAESTFVLSITPTAAGAFSFTVTIANDDLDENPFVFTYNGNTAATSTGGGGGGGGDGGCSTGGSGHYSWMVLLGLLSMIVVATRIRSSKA